MCKLRISPWNFNTKFFPTYPWYNVHIMARARYLHSELSGHEKCRITAQFTEVLVWNLAPDYTHRAQLFYSRTRHKECSRRQKFLTNWSNVLTQAHCESSTQEEVAHCESWGMSIKKDNTIVERNLTTFFNQQLDEKECNKQVHVHCPSDKSLLYHHSFLLNNHLNQFSCLKLKLARANTIFVAYSNCCVSCTIIPHT